MAFGEEAASVPVVNVNNWDLSPESREQVVQQIARASAEWGFFQLINHGVDLDKMKQAYDISKAFFMLPQEEKMKSAITKRNFADDDGYASKTLVPDALKALWRDFVHLRTMPESVKNISKWPAQPAGYREINSELCAQVHKLMIRLTEVLSEGAGLGSSGLKDALGELHERLLINYYPICPNPKESFGLIPHTDLGALTVLLRDEISGLQVLKDNEWTTVGFVPGALVVNISDQFEVLSNGRYKSVLHRVLVNEKSDRMSMAYNLACSMDKELSPLNELIDEQHPKRYKSVIFRDYLIQLAQKGHQAKYDMMLMDAPSS